MNMSDSGADRSWNNGVHSCQVAATGRRHGEQGLAARHSSLFMFDQSEWYGDVFVATKASLRHEGLNTYYN